MAVKRKKKVTRREFLGPVPPEGIMDQTNENIIKRRKKDIKRLKKSTNPKHKKTLKRIQKNLKSHTKRLFFGLEE